MSAGITLPDARDAFYAACARLDHVQGRPAAEKLEALRGWRWAWQEYARACSDALLDGVDELLSEHEQALARSVLHGDLNEMLQAPLRRLTA